MPNYWLPGAEHLSLPDTAPCDAAYPPKAIAHITWDKNATKAAPQALVPFENLRSYFSTGGASMAPHILWDPFTGRFAQYYPADSRSKSVVDSPGGTRTNRAGKVVIQIEAVFFPWCVVNGKAYERLVDTPCLGWPELHAWVKSWGVPDAWPMGKPVNFDPNRSESVWETKGGWYGHSQVPENDHQDPGSWPDFIMETDVNLTDTFTLPKSAYNPNPQTATVGEWLAFANQKAGAALESASAANGKLDTLTAKVNSLAVGGVDLDALAAKVADLLAARLKS
jgi:hypothetical protein